MQGQLFSLANTTGTSEGLVQFDIALLLKGLDLGEGKKMRQSCMGENCTSQLDMNYTLWISKRSVKIWIMLFGCEILKDEPVLSCLMAQFSSHQQTCQHGFHTAESLFKKLKKTFCSKRRQTMQTSIPWSNCACSVMYAVVFVKNNFEIKKL